MLQGEHSAILSTFIKLPFVIKTLFCLFLSGHFTQVLLYVLSSVREKKSRSFTNSLGNTMTAVARKKSESETNPFEKVECLKLLNSRLVWQCI